MTSKEIQSLSRQILHTYAANNRATRPMRVYLTGCKEEVIQIFRHQHDGFDNWQLFLDKRCYTEIFPKPDLVYLTSDTDTVLPAVDTSKVYIIGGIVDHNRLKNITANRANEQGIATAQLPIGDYIEMKSRKVLAVNHVFEILVNVVNNGGDWTNALEVVLPTRKEFSVKGKNNEGDDGPLELTEERVSNPTSTNDDVNVSTTSPTNDVAGDGNAPASQATRSSGE